MQESILRFFQTISTPFLDKFFTYSTMLGEQYFIILIVCWIYWNYSKKEGFIMLFLFLLSTMMNLILKDIFQTKRPFQKLQNFTGKRIETAMGYSFPSGHTQGVTTLFANLALIFKKTKYLVLAIFISLLVAVSRVYLGVHWPIDVLGGIVAGIYIVLAFYHRLSALYENPEKFKKTILLILFLFYLILFIVMALNQFVLKTQLDLKSYLSIVGIVSGCFIGFLLEEKKLPFTPKAAIWKKILRYLIGLAVNLILLIGLKELLPVHVISDWFRYFLVGMWITGIFPMLGIKLLLFEKENPI